MNDSVDLVKTVIEQYIQSTNEKIEQHSARTDSALSLMAASVTDMSKAVQESSRQLARYEERQSAQSDRINRIETAQGELSKKLDRLKDTLTPDITHNSLVRKAALWTAAVVVSGAMGGGIAFLWFLLRAKVS